MRKDGGISGIGSDVRFASAKVNYTWSLTSTTTAGASHYKNGNVNDASSDDNDDRDNDNGDDYENGCDTKRNDSDDNKLR